MLLGHILHYFMIDDSKTEPKQNIYKIEHCFNK